MSRHRKPPPASRRVVRGILAGLGAGFVAALVVPAAIGWRPLTVMSGSMSPSIDTGDVVVTRPLAATEIAPGDVVTFRDPLDAHRLITHRVRVVAVHGRAVDVVTRGDANTGVEKWSVPVDGSVGRVVYRLPRLGYALHPLAMPMAQLFFLGLPVMLWGLMTLRAIWRSDSPPRRRHAAHAAGVWRSVGALRAQST
ncbi:MAG: signal peptidase [Frankiaceae bacterium]|nr:signal peptidase [Frankiaceae bacterium]